MLSAYFALNRPELSPWARSDGLRRLQSHHVSSSVSRHEKKCGNSHCSLKEKQVTHRSQKKPQTQKQRKRSANHLANTQEFKYPRKHRQKFVTK